MPPPRKFSVALIQMSVLPDFSHNLERALAFIDQAAQRGASLICLPELFAAQYFCQKEDPANFDLAEPVPGPTTKAIARAAERNNVVVVAPFFERRAAGLYHNSVAVVDADKGVTGLYRKMHIP